MHSIYIYIPYSHHIHYIHSTYTLCILNIYAIKCQCEFCGFEWLLNLSSKQKLCGKATNNQEYKVPYTFYSLLFQLLGHFICIQNIKHFFPIHFSIICVEAQKLSCPSHNTSTILPCLIIYTSNITY